MTSVEDQIKVLVRKRGVLKGKLTALKKFVDAFNENSDLGELVMRQTKLLEDIVAFEEVQGQIEALSDNTDGEIEERTAYENDCYSYRRKVEKLLSPPLTQNNGPQQTDNRLNSSRSSVVSEGNQLSHLTNFTPQFFVNVPKLELPKFSGSYEEWPGFADAFKASIHNDSRFTDAQRLVYLRSCLSGKAANKIESLETTDANYSIAWNELERYYNDPNAYIIKRIDALFDLPNCNKTPMSMSELSDGARKHYRALEALGKPFLEYFPLYIITSKMDDESRIKWKERIQGSEPPTMKTLLEFLHSRQKVLEDTKQVKYDKNTINNNPRLSRPQEPRRSSAAFTSQTSPFCSVCKDSHFTYTCKKLLDLSVNDRMQLAKNLQLCVNCLRSNHSINDCYSVNYCKICKEKHHTLLHPETANTQTISCSASNISGQVLLSTAIIDILDRKGNPHACRVLLDTGSQPNFITEKFAQKLDLIQNEINTPVNSIHSSVEFYKYSIHAEIQSRVNNFSQSLPFLITSHLPETSPSQHINAKLLSIPPKIRLADPGFYKSDEIDAIIGNQLFLKLLSVGQIESHGITFQNTRLGWIIGGQLNTIKSDRSPLCGFASEVLNRQISSFWEIEEGPHEKVLSAEEASCEKHFIDNTTRDSASGRYTVKLPFNDKKGSLGESFPYALKRFISLEKSLNRNLSNKTQYVEFMREYEALGHMSECYDRNEKVGYFLPHHAVLKQSSLTTKLRVVFDASAKTSNSISLNDVLLTGPTIQEDLLSIIIRFRLHSYVLTADAEKMYRQIAVHEDDRPYQKILWRENENEPLKTFILNTVTYGTKPASFLSTRVLKQLAIDESKSFPVASAIVARDFYMDDLLTGAKTLSEAKKLRDDLIDLTKRGGFNLRQWASNDSNLTSDLTDQSSESYLSLNVDETVKTLGVFWNAKQDCITYQFNHTSDSLKITKREILSQIARLFDPLGLLGPIIIKAKILMQSLWQLKIDWDETVPQTVYTTWQNYKSQLPLLHNVEIDRKVIIDNYTNLQLHCFCDASEKAYGACIYVRSSDSEDRVVTKLLCAKSRVAPLKTISLPRLELCAALLLINLFKSVKQSLNTISFDKITFWSDSTVTLQWISTSPHVLKTFISNRVTEIQNYSSPDQWRHIPSQDNPADLISRGLAVTEFLNNRLWVNGPSWLGCNECEWPKFDLPLSQIPETKAIISFPSIQTDDDIFKRFKDISTFRTLRRVFAFCLRFINNCRKPISAKTMNHHPDRNIIEPLSVYELQAASNFIIKRVQSCSFAKESYLLKRSKQIEGNLASLNPFLDSEGILRVGGRLSLSTKLTYSEKHQALLPKKGHVTDLIIRETHVKYFHAGIQATLSSIRQRYWIINGRQVVRNIIKHCIECCRANPSLSHHLMGNLPEKRLEFTRAFLHAGVDYCGPFFIKEKRRRNRNKDKVYVAVFVCLASKAVHLEIVFDLTTEAFLAALKRFFARRGKCSDLYSDNATNFVGANKELIELYELYRSDRHIELVSNALTNENIRWHFIPPKSPHFGGLWEAAVKSFKIHVVRVLGDMLLAVDEFLTYVIEIEAILNSRPITPLSSDPNDLNALSPGHFLIGVPLTSIPEYDFIGTPSARLSDWQRVQQLRQHFWRRWYKEYLHELTVRKKWHTGHTKDIQVGTIVTMKEDNLSPMQWPLARIIAVHPGKDGIVRVATVKTSKGEYKRSIKNLSPLPLDT